MSQEEEGLQHAFVTTRRLNETIRGDITQTQRYNPGSDRPKEAAELVEDLGVKLDLERSHLCACASGSRN